MNEWETVWKSYMNDCTRTKILKDAYRSIKALHKVLLLLSLVSFIIFVTGAFYSIFNPEQIDRDMMFLLFALFEGIFLLMAERAVKNLSMTSYSFQEQAQVPPEDTNHQKIRYLKFRFQLKKSKIEAKNITTLIDILKAREELEEVKGTYVNRFFGFLMALIIALIVSVIKVVELDVLVLICAYGFFIGFLVFAIASMVPAKIERIRELKYFLVMYEKQDQYETVSSNQINKNDDLVSIV
ncbi:hypothetical protein [Moritella sp. PE36]|uniref:hypothetical protein n=1 Tax=Moritella sp. PE36 TaxID=58051 RepID=UPI0002F2C0DF|nr:hypothetical protein [Moritella sp. PE36]